MHLDIKLRFVKLSDKRLYLCALSLVHKNDLFLFDKKIKSLPIIFFSLNCSLQAEDVALG